MPEENNQPITKAELLPKSKSGR